MTTLTNKIRDERLFFGGLNTDDDPRFLPEGDYVNAVDVIKNEDGSNGILVNIRGNTSVFEKEVTYTKEYLCGWAYYKKNESVILCLYYEITGTPGNRIVEFNPQTGVSTDIIDDVLLGFQDPTTNDYFIKVDILDDWLSLTDNNINPITVNIDTIKTDSPTITLDYLTTIKKPPFIVSDGKFGYDDTIEFSNIPGFFYKFKYRYTYNGFRKSVWSGAGSVLVHPNDSSVNENLVFVDVDNYIDIKFDSGSSDVSFIDFAMQNDDTGSWYKILVLDRTNPINIYDAIGTPIASISDDTEYYYRFYNDAQYATLDINDVIKPYDNVPKIAETLSYVTDNRLIYGGGTFNYDVDDIEVDIDFSPVTNSPEPQPSVAGNFSFLNSGGNCTLTAAYDLTLILPGGATTGDVVMFRFDYPVTSVGSIRLNNVLSFPFDAATVNDKFDYISSVIPSVGWANTVPADTPPDTNTVTLNGNNIEFSATWNGVSGTGTGTTSDTTSYIVTDKIISSFKLGTSKQFGIVYYDGYGRKSSVLLGDGSNVNFEDNGIGISTGRTEVDFTINHDAPDWAKYYRFAYVKNRNTFTNVYVYYDSYVYDSDGNIEEGVVAIWLNPFDSSGSSTINFDKQYNIEVGDKIKAYSAGVDSLVSPTKQYIIRDIRTTIYSSASVELNNNFLIVSVDDYVEGAIRIPSFFTKYYATISKGQKAISEDVFYEVEDIGLCNSSVAGDHVPNTGTLVDGDVWIRYSKTLISILFSSQPTYSLISMEEYYPSNNVTGILSNTDMVNIEDENYREQYANVLSYSNKFFQDTQINGLSTFDLDSKKDVSDSYGKIKGLEQLGKSLVVICEKKVLSGGVGYTEYLDASGNINQIKSDSVIGYLRASDERYGTFLKESVVNTGHHVYFFDLYNKVYVRKASNGLYPISGSSITPNGATNYKMRTFFSNLSEGLIDSISSNDIWDVKVFSGYDVFYDSIYVTFVDRINNDNNISLIFHEPSARWISKYIAFKSGLKRATMYPFTDATLLSYEEYESKLYKNNDSTADRCNLYGEQFDSSVQFVSNKLANEIKVFNNIAVHSNDQWDIDDDDAITIPAKEDYREVGAYIFKPQSSKIFNGNWRLEDGIYRSEFLRDGKTTSDTIKLIDIYNGALLRGEYLNITMTNNNTDETRLFKVAVDSELNK